MRGFFITGTDTEIGKTCISAGLTHAFAQLGLRVAAIKPIAAGQDFVDGAWVNEDVRRLRAASNMALSDAEVGPLQLRAACAPHIAARLEDCTIDREPLLHAVRSTAARAELCIVEGVGGFRVPLSLPSPGRPKMAGAPLGGGARLSAPGGEHERAWDTADLAADLQLPVVLVVGLRLGCINHALLTAEAIAARGLRLAAWVANTVDTEMPHVADNLAALTAVLSAAPFNAPCWGHVPRLFDPSPAAVAAHLPQPPLLQALESFP